jgi:hypothetical protein
MSTSFRNYTLGVSLAAFVGSIYVYTLTRVGTVSAALATGRGIARLVVSG